MASQVLSGNSNPSYTNTTGQNVRLILNVLENITSISWGGVTTNLSDVVFGQKLPLDGSGGTYGTTGTFRVAPPYQIALASGQSFSATCGKYNILVITEN